jgi:GNAT superfamily N-acetyltransferase
MDPANEPTVEPACPTDVPRYVELAQAAQTFIRSKGLAQWVPAAHSAFLPNLTAKVEKCSLRKVSQGKDAIAFFDFSFEPSEWWSSRPAIAGYISGIVVARANWGCGVGSFILKWAEAQVRAQGANFLRLDCHAGNDWLCEYYRAKGFAEVARMEQHPGYFGALYQKPLTQPVTAKTKGPDPLRPL